MALVTCGNLLSNGSLDEGMTPHPTLNTAQLSFSTLVLQCRQQGAPWKLGAHQEWQLAVQTWPSAGHQGNSEAPFCSVAADKEPVNWYMRGGQNTREKVCAVQSNMALICGLAFASAPRISRNIAGRPQRGLWGWHNRRLSIKCVPLPARCQLCRKEHSSRRSVCQRSLSS